MARSRAERPPKGKPPMPPACACSMSAGSVRDAAAAADAWARRALTSVVLLPEASPFMKFGRALSPSWRLVGMPAPPARDGPPPEADAPFGWPFWGGAACGRDRAGHPAGHPWGGGGTA